MMWWKTCQCRCAPPNRRRCGKKRRRLLQPQHRRLVPLVIFSGITNLSSKDFGADDGTAVDVITVLFSDGCCRQNQRDETMSGQPLPSRPIPSNGRGDLSSNLHPTCARYPPRAARNQEAAWPSRRARSTCAKCGNAHHSAEGNRPRHTP